MAFQRGIYGVEYNLPSEPPESHGFRWFLVLVFLVALGSFGVTVYRRWRAPSADPSAPSEVAPSAEAVRPVAAVRAPPPLAPTNDAVRVTSLDARSTEVRALLLRLDAAEKKRDIALAATTIESIRALPGNPAADLDDRLARRLGVLNMERLFTQKNRQWVEEVEVRRGANATRLAREYGSTLASFVKLNGGDSKLRVGQKVFVLSHPRFILVVHRLTRTADLSLNGKLFKRYYLANDLLGSVGTYVYARSATPFWNDLGVFLKPDDRAEIEMLIPAGTRVVLSDF